MDIGVGQRVLRGGLVGLAAAATLYVVVRLSIEVVRLKPVDDLLPASNGFAGVFVVAGVLLVVGVPVAIIVGRLVAKALHLGRPGTLAACGILGATVAYFVGSQFSELAGRAAWLFMLALICLPYAALAALPAFAAPSPDTAR